MISVPAGVTSVEKRAVRDAASSRRFRGVPDRGAMAAASPTSDQWPVRLDIIDIGGYQRDRSHLARAIVVSTASASAATRWTSNLELRAQEVQPHDRRPHGEEVKIQIAPRCLSNASSPWMSRRDLIAGLPRTIPMTSSEVMEAWSRPYSRSSAPSASSSSRRRRSFRATS